MKREHALSRLLRSIKAEEERTRQYALQVRISRSIGRDLAAMEAEDWHDASNGWTEMAQCNKLANDFLREGEAAAHGLRLSVVGPILEVSSADDAPDVEILAGIPFDEQVV